MAKKSSDQRKYRRISSNVQVKIRKKKISQENLEVLQFSMVNISLGGVFVETNTPFPLQTVVELHIPLPNNKEVHAIGVVKWITSEHNNRGMGVEFLKVTTEAQDLETFIENQGSKSSGPSSQQDIIGELFDDPNLKPILSKYFKNVGKEVDVLELANDIGMPIETLKEYFVKMESVGLMSKGGKTIKFIKPKDNKLWIKIVQWGAKNFLS